MSHQLESDKLKEIKEIFERIADQVISTAGAITIDVGDTPEALEGQRRAHEDVDKIREFLESIDGPSTADD